MAAVKKSQMPNKIRFRYYEPFLMTQLRLLDAFLGTTLFFLIDKYCHSMPSHAKEIVFVLFFLILAVLHHSGIYRSWRFSSLGYEISRILLGCFTVYVTLFFLLYFLNISHWVPRIVFLYWMIAWPLCLSLGRIGIRLILRRLRKKGLNTKKAVIAGINDTGKKLAHLITENLWVGTQFLGFFDDTVISDDPFPVLGSLDQITSFVSEHHVDMVYISFSMNEQSKIHDVLRFLSDSTVSVFLVPDFFFVDVMIGGHLTYFENLPVIGLQESPVIGIHRFIKRLFDILVSSAALVILTPLFLCIAAAVRMAVRGSPVIFKQWRYGLDGQPIQIYKFCTMMVCEDGYRFQQATPNDRRITPIGAFLRRNSLDELPQLFNVLLGNMSLVGPRPHPVAMNETYRRLLPGYMLRHKVKPGITGLAQLNGFRGETDTMDKIETRLKYDIAYIRDWSLWNDVKILFKTLWNGSWHTNAY